MPEHEVYFLIELAVENNVVLFSHMTDVINFDNLSKETIIFPIKIRDVPVNSAIAISIYDLNKEMKDSLLGSTAFYLFDSKRRLRQGIQDLVIWKNKERDLSYSFCTPGFPDENPIAKEINTLLSKIDTKVQNKKNKRLHNVIKERLHQLYIESEHAYLEIKLPYFDIPVVYDEVNLIFQTYFKVLLCISV